MAIDPVALRTRRAVIGAALGGAAAAAATSLAGPLSARAATDGNVILGQGDDAGENEANAPTIVKNLVDAQVSLAGQHAAAGTGISGTSATGTGIRGSVGDTTNASADTTETGVYGYADISNASAGVWGESFQHTGVVGSGDTGVFGVGYFGVYGQGSTGVVGDADASSIGVYGFAGSIDLPAPSVAAVGVGVYARAGTTSQTALLVEGKAKFSRSQRVSSISTATYKKVTMAGVTSSSYVLATLQTSVTGCYVRAVVPTTGSFTIYLSKAPGKTIYIGYMVIN